MDNNNTFFFKDSNDYNSDNYKEKPIVNNDNSDSIFYNPNIISNNSQEQNSEQVDNIRNDSLNMDVLNTQSMSNTQNIVEEPTITEIPDIVTEPMEEVNDPDVVSNINVDVLNTQNNEKSTDMDDSSTLEQPIEKPDLLNDNISSEDENYIVFSHVSKSYLNGEVYVQALKNASFNISKGEMVIILGNSGAGKSTALNLLGGMDQATSGTITVDGKDITKYNLDELTDYRREDIGFVFQFYNLIQNLTVKENIQLASEISKDNLDVETLLDRVGLKNRINNFPSQLSGGEQQRVSIVRALIKKPKILLCDEPTGALDYNTSREVLKLLQDITREQDITVIIITHNNDIAAIADKIIRFKSGEIIGIEKNIPKNVEDIEW